MDIVLPQTQMSFWAVSTAAAAEDEAPVMGTVVTVPPVTGVFLRQRGLEQWGRRAGFDMAVADMERDYFMSIYVLQIIH